MKQIKAEAITDRIRAGDAVLQAAESVDTGPVKRRLAAFASTHRKYATAAGRAHTAETTVHDAHDAAGEADTGLDHALEALATALVGDGMPRANPFKPLGFASPSTVAEMGYAAEAKESKKLAAKVLATKSLGAKSFAAAKAVNAAALKLEAALARTTAAETAWQQQLTARNVLALPWATDLAGLKRLARATDDGESRGLFDALFGVALADTPRRTKAKPAGDGSTPPATTTTTAATPKKKRRRH